MQVGDRVRICGRHDSRAAALDGQERTITGIGTFDVRVSDKTYRLAPALLMLLDRGVPSQITFAQACALVALIDQMVSKTLRRAGMDPHTEAVMQKLGDPADLHEEIDEALFGTLEDLGVQVIRTAEGARN